MKPRSVTFYKHKLDKVFSKYIRARDGHICFTCGHKMEPNRSQCGHFIPRQYLALRFSEVNCHCQCYACNMIYNGQPSVYALKLQKLYGKKIIEELEKKRQEITKLEPSWYLEKIAYYETKLETL